MTLCHSARITDGQTDGRTDGRKAISVVERNDRLKLFISRCEDTSSSAVAERPRDASLNISLSHSMLFEVVCKCLLMFH